MDCRSTRKQKINWSLNRCVEGQKTYFLAKRYYVTFGLWYELSVCRLSVTLLHLRQRFQLFDNIFAPPYSPGTRTVCIKILGKNSKGLLGTVQVMTNWCFQPIYILLCFENGTRYGHSYNGRRIGTRMQSVEWCHFQ